MSGMDRIVYGFMCIWLLGLLYGCTRFDAAVHEQAYAYTLVSFMAGLVGFPLYFIGSACVRLFCRGAG